MASLTVDDCDTQLTAWTRRLRHAETNGWLSTVDMCRDRIDAWLEVRSLIVGMSLGSQRHHNDWAVHHVPP